MRDSKPIAVMALLVTAAAVGSIFLCVKGLPPRIDSAPHRAAGNLMAEQTLALLQPGGHVTVIARDTTSFKNPAADFQFAAFQKRLRKAGVQIAFTHALQLDPLRPLEVPPGDFLEFIRNSSPSDVIVSFMGPPLLSDSQRAQLGASKPAIVAFCPGRMPEVIDLNQLFERGLLSVAVVTRPTCSALKNTPKAEAARTQANAR